MLHLWDELKKVPPQTRIPWKLFTCQSKACKAVFNLFTDEETTWIDLDDEIDSNPETELIKTERYIAKKVIGRFYYNDVYGKFDEDKIDADLFQAYQTYIESNYEIEIGYQWNRTNRTIDKNDKDKHITFPTVYNLYYPPDFKKATFMLNQFRKLFKLNLSVGSFRKAIQNIDNPTLGVCAQHKYSIERTNHFKHFNI